MSNIISNPQPEWLKLVEPGHVVWLVKENKEAVIQSEFGPRIHHTMFNHVIYGYEKCESCYNDLMGSVALYIDNQIVRWHVSINGKGLNGSLLMLPIENNIITIEEYEYKCDLAFCKCHSISMDKFRALQEQLKTKYSNPKLMAMTFIGLQHEDVYELINKLIDIHNKMEI